MRKLIWFLLCAAAWAQQPIAVTDGTNGNVAVKPAATAPAVADKAHVVALSPNNSGLPVNQLQTVQKTSNASSGSVASLAKAYVSNVTAGNSLVVSFCNGNVNAPTAPITDTLTLTWTKASHNINGSAFECDQWFAVTSTAGAETITVTPGGANASIAMEIYELSGTIQVSAVAQGDVTTTNSGSSATAQTVDIIPESSGSLVLGMVGLGTAAQTVTPGTGWANDSGQQNPATPAGLFSFVATSQFADDVANLSVSATFTSEPWIISAVVYHSPMIPVSGMVRVPGTTPSTADAALRCTLTSAASTNATNCKAFSGNVYGYRFINTTTTIYYLRMYNLTVAPTCSSATGFIETIPIPPAGAAGQAGGVVSIEPMGEGYSTGIGFCFTGGSSSTDNTNAATGVFGSILYR